MSRDFRRLWFAFGISAFGSAVGLGALPLIAVLVLDASTFQVSMLAALSAVAGAAIGLPMGDFIEQRYKRPVMIAADLVRFAVLVSVPIAAAFDVLTYAQLCVVGVVHAAGMIAFQAASGAHLKALVPAERRAEANSKFEQTNWIALSIGPAIGGGLVSLVGATATLAVDGVSFLLSALGIRRIQHPEPKPVRREGRPEDLAGPLTERGRLGRGGLDGLENVGVGLALPVRQFLPIGDIRGFRVGDVLVDLSDPAQGHEAALLVSRQLRRVAGADFDEFGNLRVDTGRAAALPLRGAFPRCDIACFGLAGEVFLNSCNPGVAEDSAGLKRHCGFSSGVVVQRLASAEISALRCRTSRTAAKGANCG